MADGVDVRGTTVWSLLDNFEWAMGTCRASGYCTSTSPCSGAPPRAPPPSMRTSQTATPSRTRRRNATRRRPVQAAFVGEAAALQRIVNKSPALRQQGQAART